MKILVISSYYAPFNNASSLDIQKKLELLKKIYDEVHLITTFEKNSLEFEKIDNMLIYRIKNKYKNYNAFSLENNNLNTEPKKINLLKKKIKEKMIKNFIIPDPHVFWISSAYNFIKVMNLKEYECIITMSQTNSAHIIGLKLKKYFKDIKWISYWNDPWFANLTKYNILRNIIERYLEKKVIKNCDGFLLFCDEFKERLIKKFKISKEKIYEIDGFYKEYIKVNNKINNKIKIIHAGDLYLPIRDIGPFIKAITEINKNNIEYENKILFIFLGEIKDEHYIEKLKKISNVELLGKKSYLESKDIIEKADILLLFGNRGVKRIPSKIFEYISYSKPIITILGEKKEPLIKIFKKISRGPIVNNDSESIKRILLTIPKEFKYWQEEYTREIEEYNMEVIIPKVKKWLERLK